VDEAAADEPGVQFLASAADFLHDFSDTNVVCLRDRRGLKQIRIFSLRIVRGVLHVRCKIM
jgi:hypothetical protein